MGCLAGLADGMAATASEDGTIKIWKGNKCQRWWNCVSEGERQYSTGRDMRTRLIVDGNHLISVFRGALKTWNMDTGEQEGFQSCSDDVVVSCAAVDGDNVIFGVGGKIEVWNKNSDTYVRSLTGPEGSSVMCCAVDGDHIVSAWDNPAYIIWDKNTGDCKKTWDKTHDAHNLTTPLTICVMKDHIISNAAGRLHVLNKDTGEFNTIKATDDDDGKPYHIDLLLDGDGLITWYVKGGDVLLKEWKYDNPSQQMLSLLG